MESNPPALVTRSTQSGCHSCVRANNTISGSIAVSVSVAYAYAYAYASTTLNNFSREKKKAAHEITWTAFGELLGLGLRLTVCFFRRRCTMQ